MARLHGCNRNVPSSKPDELVSCDEVRGTRLLTLADFLQEFRVGRTRTFLLIKSGELPFRHAGRRLVILREDAEAWAKSLPLARSARRLTNG